jgi:hypothetical protein
VADIASRLKVEEVGSSGSRELRHVVQLAVRETSGVRADLRSMEFEPQSPVEIGIAQTIDLKIDHIEVS